MTVNFCALVTGPSVVCTLTVPELAPFGTVTVNAHSVAALTVAVVPLNLTVSALGLV
jgi:hypothetical protein